MLTRAASTFTIIGVFALGPVRGDVAYEGVSFGYGADRPAISDVTFEVAAGCMVALVGATGAGKTTTASLLTRLHDPNAGTIRIDGIDIRDIKLDSLRHNIGIVFQESALLNRPIAENIRTLVGERGSTLSGGERQRIAIARALLNDPPILILDEATSALDSVTEASVQRALSALMRSRTTFVIEQNEFYAWLVRSQTQAGDAPIAMSAVD